SPSLYLTHSVLLFLSTPPPPTHIYPLSLHDALPISLLLISQPRCPTPPSAESATNFRSHSPSIVDFAGLGRWRPRTKFWFTPLNSLNFFQSRCENQIGLALFV